MAPTARSFVIDASLCFVLSKYNKISAMKIAEILCDCFSHEDTTAAKTQLVKDVQNLTLNLSSNNLRARRDVDHSERQRKEAVDIVTIITTIDQQGFISCLPHYVVDNTDSIPSLKVEDGELKYLMARINKLDDAILCVQQTVNKMFNYKSGGLSHISHRLADNTHVVSRSADEPVVNHGPTAAIGQNPPLTSGGLMFIPSNMYVDQQQRCSTTTQSTYVGETRAITASAIASNVNNTSASTYTTHGVTSVGGVGEPAGASNQGRWADCQPSSASSAVDTDDDFTLVESRSSKRRRVRQSPGIYNGTPGTPPAVIPGQRASMFSAIVNTAATNAKKPTTRKQMMIGTLRSPPNLPPGVDIQSGRSQTTGKLQAAKPLRGKAVFCVDNVSNDVMVADLEQFVKGMGVRVIQCNETKPRRSYRQKQNDIVPNDHKAFFLSINKLDTKLLLNPSKWPADVSVSPWFFKKKDDQPTTNPTTDQNIVTAVPTASAAAASFSTLTTVADITARVNSPTATPTVATAAVAAAETETDEQMMSLSPIRTDDQQLHHTGNSDEFDEASDTLNDDGDDAAHNSTSVQVVDLSAIIN